jgi:hypothetical protein
MKKVHAGYQAVHTNRPIDAHTLDCNIHKIVSSLYLLVVLLTGRKQPLDIRNGGKR